MEPEIKLSDEEREAIKMAMIKEMVDELMVLIRERDNLRALAHELAGKKARMDELILSLSNFRMEDIINYLKITAALSDYNVQHSEFADRVNRFMDALKP